MALSIGVFFSTLIAGLASSMPAAALFSGPRPDPANVPTNVANLPPVGTLFAAFLGYNPMRKVLGPQVITQLPPGNAATVVGERFCPNLVADSFHHGLVIVFCTAIGVSLIGAIASLFRTAASSMTNPHPLGIVVNSTVTHVSGAGNVGTVEFTTPTRRSPARAAERLRGVADR